MNAIQFVQIIRHGLPGCCIEELNLKTLAARVRYGGQRFDVSGGMLDGYPLWLVTTPHYTVNDATGKVLTMLDAMTDEMINDERPWKDTEDMIRRLRELAEEIENDDTDEPV